LGGLLRRYYYLRDDTREFPDLDTVTMTMTMQVTHRGSRATSPTPAPSHSALSCTVIICTRDRPDCLDQCLAALALVDYPNFDILVVDNAPSDSRSREIAARWNVRYLVEPRAGLSYARNAGCRASTADVLAFLDDDSIPEPDWLRALAAGFADPSVLAVTGRILPPGADVAAEVRFNLDLGPEPRRFDRKDPLWFEKANFGGIGIGCNMAIHRRAFEIWSGFDERLGRGTPMHGGEESHAFFRLIEGGAVIAYLPEAKVVHPLPPLGDHLKDLSAAVPYMMLLLFETPYKSRVLRYVFSATPGTARPWRYIRPELVPRTPWRRLQTLLTGVRLYRLPRWQM
jgi:glycosyltransferase involved in cell wall biosynthesis